MLLSPECLQKLEEIDRSLKTTWAGLTLSLVFYCGAAFWILRNPSDSAGGTHLLWPLTGFALVASAAAVAWRRSRLSGDPALESALREVRPEQPDPSAGLSDPIEQRVLAALMLRQKPWIILLAIHETVGLAGLVVAITCQDPWLALPFCAVAMGLNLSLIPRPKVDVQRMVEVASLQGMAG